MDMTLKAERALTFETGGRLGRSFIGGTNFYDADHAGLQTGEQLWLALKNMELAYGEGRLHYLYAICPPRRYLTFVRLARSISLSTNRSSTLTSQETTCAASSGSRSLRAVHRRHLHQYQRYAYHEESRVPDQRQA
ncbi:uncharacterized protein BP01DRAFT_358727 [Aspergillus saccharolyticus JOP 1030-1]|uniref:Tc toxin complex TcA C-terminal TcB-binding domain-containing protein n=1 Tax=Aspergillus saccharolyticus JOP 1030-1 TaxID=1450539 RepID=A0A318ZEZ8_9EURO|nr:hypothetical protein BP01DRAFT_358727 [Aspergillus saccharolyticus JOP 1030-1]PYH43213.1 hypothetical protein BP01DRAFT_358727 [Aspergillus saccharolyticus JOP 1030-1]